MKKLKTHTDELDRILGGGIPAGHVVVLAGAPGTMKVTTNRAYPVSTTIAGTRAPKLANIK